MWHKFGQEFYGDGPPLIFETMIFDREIKGFGEHNVYMERYTTEAEAIAGHATAVEWAKQEAGGEQS